MLLLLFPAFRNSIKNKHYSVLIPLLFFVFALFTPCFYYLFHGFTQAYSRWTLFVVTSIMAYSGLYLDKIKNDNYVVLVESCAILIFSILISGFISQAIITTYKTMFEARYPIWLFVCLEILYLICLTTILCLIKEKKKPGFYWVLSGFLVTEISLMGALVIHGHGVENYSFTNKGYLKNNSLHAIIEKVQKDNPSYFRSYSSIASSIAPNDGMRNNYNGINVFHSVYNYNTADLCNWSAITNGRAPASWTGTYVQKRINLDSLLGVKYYYVEDEYFNKQNRQASSSEDFRYNVPLNYIDITNQYPNSYFKIFKNADYIDFALTFDSFHEVSGNPVESASYSGMSSGSRSLLLNEDLYLRTALINSYRESGVINDLKENHSDISSFETINGSIADIYHPLSINRYGNTYAGEEATITYYDFSSVGEKNLDVDVATYLSLNSSLTKYEKTGRASSMDSEQKYVEVIESNGEYFPNYDPKGNIYYLTGSFDDGYGTDIYFIDISNKIVTFDNHNDEFTTGTRLGKEERCFYIAPKYNIDSNGQITITKDAPKIKKVIVVNREKKVNSSHEIAIDTFTNHETKMEKLRANTVTNIISQSNHWSFETSFDKERIVVTRLAYEKGFKLYMTDTLGNKKEVNVFNAQGGFVSFVSGTGNCTYELSFETPYLNVASLISSLGVFSYFATIVSFMYVDIRQKEKNLTKLV